MSKENTLCDLFQFLPEQKTSQFVKCSCNKSTSSDLALPKLLIEILLRLQFSCAQRAF